MVSAVRNVRYVLRFMLSLWGRAGWGWFRRWGGAAGVIITGFGHFLSI